MIDEDMHQEAFAALQRLSARDQTAGALQPGLPASRIVAYAQRQDAILDLEVERALRRHAGARALYAAALGRVAVASSLSVAAAADHVTERRIGDWHLEILEETDDVPWLILRASEGTAKITMMELRLPDGTGRRLDLGLPIDGVFQLPLDPGFAEMVGLIDWLRDPATEIHLL
jgi:hypothetical protein